jgi:hypothetical protein
MVFSPRSPSRTVIQTRSAIRSATPFSTPAKPWTRTAGSRQNAPSKATFCLFGEITTTAIIDPVAIARDVLRDIGHADARWGVDPDAVNVIVRLGRQSPDIACGLKGDDMGAGG